jgi:hypothetical protein
LGTIFERGDQLGYVLFCDAPQFPDLDAAELASPEQVIDLIAPYVQHFSDLLDCECLQVCESPPLYASCSARQVINLEFTIDLRLTEALTSAGVCGGVP